MKNIIFLFLILTVSNFTFADNLSIGTIGNNGKPIYNDVNLKMIIYYIPFSVLTRTALSIEDVKRIYHLKIEIREGTEIINFIKSIENTQHEIIENNHDNYRCVIEIYYADNIIDLFDNPLFTPVFKINNAAD